MTWLDDRGELDERAIDDAIDDEDQRAQTEAASHVPPSFAAIVARAHHIDPRAVGADAVERAGKVTRAPRSATPGAATDGVTADLSSRPFGPDLSSRPFGPDLSSRASGPDLSSRASGPDLSSRAFGPDLSSRASGPDLSSRASGPDLRPLVAVLRADAERDIARRAQLGAPPCGLLVRIDVQRRAASARRWMAAVSAVAAAAAVMLGLDWLESWSARRADDLPGNAQSVSAMRDGPVVHDAEEGEPAAIEPAPAVRRPAPAVVPVQTPAAVLPEEPAPLESTALPHVVPRGAVAKVPADAALRRLDAEAQDALARGDKTGADGLYARVIVRGRRHPLVEIAFAERFAIARGRGTDVQRDLWSGYLAKFPEGRFADDAHAGLCRIAASADKEQCWRGYVDRFPSGAYRRHADRWFTSTATP